LDIFGRICNQKIFNERCDCWGLYISILVKSGYYELFDCYKILRLEPERNNALFLISSVGCRTIINSSGSSYYKNVYKLFTKIVESWKPGPNFLERPPFLDEYVVLIKCYLVGVECQIQDIITICPKKPTLNCFGNPGNVGMFTTKVYKFVNMSTSLQICSTNVCNCLQRSYMFTKPIQVKLLERILNY
jgi:hypothetical protein